MNNNSLNLNQASENRTETLGSDSETATADAKQNNTKQKSTIQSIPKFSLL